jgi:hypothetical protein
MRTPPQTSFSRGARRRRSGAHLLAIIEALIADVMSRRWNESRRRMTLVEDPRGGEVARRR